MSAADLTLVAVASGLAMLIKAVTGMGYPALFIPVVATVIGLEAAVSVVVLPNVVGNSLMAWRTWHARSETRDLVVLSIAVIIGVIVGTVVLVSVPEAPLLLLLVVCILSFVANEWWFGGLTISPTRARRASPAVGVVAGLLQGSVGVPGPVVIAWMYSYRLERDALILSLSVLFGVAALMQALTLARLDAYNADRLIAAGVALVPVLAVLPLGERLRDRLSGKQFNNAVMVMMLLAAAALLMRFFEIS